MSEIGESGTGSLEEYRTTEGSLRVYLGEPYYSAARIDRFRNYPGDLTYELYTELQRRGCDMECLLPRHEDGGFDDYEVNAYADNRDQAKAIKAIIDRAAMTKFAEMYEDIKLGNVSNWYETICDPLIRNKSEEELQLEGDEETQLSLRVYMSAYNTAANELREKALELEKSSGGAFSASKRFSESRWSSYTRVYELLCQEEYEPLSGDEVQDLITKAIDQSLQEMGMSVTCEDDESAD